MKTVEALNSSVPEKLTIETQCNVCETCGAVFGTAELLGEHVIRQHKVKTVEVNDDLKENNNEVKTFKCDQCNKKFIMERNLN